MAAVLLVEVRGETVGVRFPDMEAARAWEDAREEDSFLSVVGCVRLVSRAEALGK